MYDAKYNKDPPWQVAKIKKKKKKFQNNYDGGIYIDGSEGSGEKHRRYVGFRYVIRVFFMVFYGIFPSPFTSL